MAHRIREAMDGAARNGGPLGGEGKIVEADETRFGTKRPENGASQMNSAGSGTSAASKCL